MTNLTTKILVVAEFNALRLAMLTFWVWLAGNLAMYFIEKMAWGKSFVHYGDLIWLATVFFAYIYLVNEMVPHLAAKWIDNREGAQNDRPG